MPKETVLERIVSHVLGHKYYANIINLKGTNKLEISCFIFRSREEAEQHRKDLDDTLSYMYVETVSFRSHKDYPATRR